MPRAQKKKKILNDQADQKQIQQQIVGVVQELRSKPNWFDKINDPTIREKYKTEAKSQGIQEAVFSKALNILGAISRCHRPIIKDFCGDHCVDIPVRVVVGDVEFPTSTRVLTADSESMLNRMFRPPWFQELEVSSLHTNSNSPALFAVILAHLEALAENRPQHCPNIDSLSSEEVLQLMGDCDQLGLRKLSIAIVIESNARLEIISQSQRKAVSAHSSASNTLRSLVEEKRKIEERLAQLPRLIELAEEKEAECRVASEKVVAHRPATAGDHVMMMAYPGDHTNWKVTSGKDGSFIAVQDTNWKPFTVTSGMDGSLIAVQDSNQKRRLPLPSPTLYHHAPPTYDRVVSGEVLACDNLLPDILIAKLEQELDSLVHLLPLDLHPGSEGQVVDLIHPSLYPYIDSLTAVTDEEALAKCADINGDYAWLPAEFHIHPDTTVSIESYINNLSQEGNEDLYYSIAQTFRCMLPMFEEVLGKDLKDRDLQVIVKAAYYFISPGDVYSGALLLPSLIFTASFFKIYFLHCQDPGIWKECHTNTLLPVEYTTWPPQRAFRTMCWNSESFWTRRISTTSMVEQERRLSWCRRLAECRL
jgi:hypothetical protein